MAVAVSRWEPFRDLMSIQNELSRLFGRTYAGSEAGTRAGAWVPPLDIFETKPSLHGEEARVHD